MVVLEYILQLVLEGEAVLLPGWTSKHRVLSGTWDFAQLRLALHVEGAAGLESITASCLLKLHSQ